VDDSPELPAEPRRSGVMGRGRWHVEEVRWEGDLYLIMTLGDEGRRVGGRLELERFPTGFGAGGSVPAAKTSRRGTRS
jgi:hypothetical protein